MLVPGCRLGAARAGVSDGRSLASGWLKVAGIVTVAIGGVLMVVFNPKHKAHGSGNPHLGMVLLLGNCLSMAAYVLIQKKYIFKNATPATWRTHPVNVTAWSYLFGAMFMALTSLYYVATDASAFNVMPRDLAPCHPSPAAHRTGITTQWCEAHSGAHWNSTVESLCDCDRVDIGSFLVPISYAAFVSSAMCYGLITYANKHLPSTVVTAFWPLQVPVAVVLEYFATSGADSLSGGQGAGAGIIALALLMVTYSNHLEAQRAGAATPSIRAYDSESSDLGTHLLGDADESGALKVQVRGVGEKGY